MIIDCISDLHGFYPSLKGGDLLIIAGDITTNDGLPQCNAFFKWLKRQKYKRKILIAGNHDNFLTKGFPKNKKEADSLKEVQAFLKAMKEDIDEDFEYLCDSGTEFGGLRIWGTPWSLTFPEINPHCTAFTGTEKDLCSKFCEIPNDIDILISHSPMWNILDENKRGHRCGSFSMRETVDRVKPRLFVCGHIHEQGGQQLIYKHAGPNTIVVNASQMDGDYEYHNRPIRIEL